MTSNPLRLSSPSELLKYLEELGIAPKKSLSQNFLIDGNIIRKIVQFADVNPGETILEIGPGPGALTEGLLEKGASVIAIEKDDVLAAALRKWEGVTVICDDVMKVQLPKCSKVVANLPYSITTPILHKLLPSHDLFSDVTTLIQLEVAEKLVAKPRDKNYGPLTIFANFYSTPEFGFKVKNSSFFPKPKVDSAIIKFHLKKPPKEIDSERFFLFLQTAFGQRRKMLTSSLKSLLQAEKIAQALQSMGLSEKSRPEELSKDQFLDLFLRSS